MANITGKWLTTLTVKGIRNGSDIELGVYGLFYTEKVYWTYHITSFYKNSQGDIYLTTDICSCNHNVSADHDNIRRYGRICQTLEEGKQYIEIFKLKLDTGSNTTTSEVRDKKIDELLK